VDKRAEALENLKLDLTSPRPLAATTISNYVSIASRFLTWLGDRIPPNDKDLRRYFIHQRQQGMKEGSLQIHFAVLQKLCLANKWDWNFTGRDRPEASDQEEAPGFTEEEVIELIKKRDRYSAAECFYLAIATTFFPRRVELAVINKHSIKDNTIYIDTHKKGEKRWHLIPDEIMPYIAAYKVYEHATSSLSAVFHRICQKGLGKDMPGYGWHSFRRTGDTILPICLARAGKPLTYVGIFLRWSPKETGRRILGAAMAGVYTQQKLLSADPFFIDREVLSCHPFLFYWRTPPVVTPVPAPGADAQAQKGG